MSKAAVIFLFSKSFEINALCYIYDSARRRIKESEDYLSNSARHRNKNSEVNVFEGDFMKGAGDEIAINRVGLDKV